MPPVTSMLNHDTVLQVTNALPPTLQRRFVTKSIISQTREALRLVQTKVALGSLGKHDRQETRAAALLDYVLRKQQQQQQQQSSSSANNDTQQETIDLKHLAAVNGTKLVHFQNLHQTLGNYFHDIYYKNIDNNNAPVHNKQRKSTNSNAGNRNTTTTGKQTSGTCGGEQGINAGGGTAAARNWRHASSNNNSSNANTVVATQTILPDLAIRLAGYLQNPHAVTVKAARLLHDMRDYSYASQSGVERRGQEYDYVRYWPAYEAAAFFVVATTWQNALHHQHHQNHYGSPSSMTTSSSTSSNSNTTRRRSSKNKNKSGAAAATNNGGGGGGVLVAAGDDEDHDSRGGVGGAGQPLQLRLEHLVAACKNHFTLAELKERLPHVQKMAALIVVAQREQAQQLLDSAPQKQQQQQQEQQQQRRQDNPPSKRARLTGARARINQASTTGPDGANDHAKNGKSNPKRNTGDNVNHGDGGTNIDNDHDNDDDDKNAVLSLYRWAECILSEKGARVRNAEKGNQTESNDGKNSGDDSNDDDDECLERLELWTRIAADQVLRKYNLLKQDQRDSCLK